MKNKLSISAAARYSGYSRDMVEYWLKKGLLHFEEVPSPGPNRIRRIRKADLDNFLERHYSPVNSKKRKTLTLEPRST